ncbi:MAG: hypothetical protein WAQ28_07320 [Bacteroidia bacterium]
MKLHILLFLSAFSVTSVGRAQPDSLKNKYFDRKWTVGININTVEPITEAGYDLYFGQLRLFNDFGQQKSFLTSFGANLSYKVKEHFRIRFSAKLTKYKVEEVFNEKNYISLSPPSNDYLIDSGYVKQSTFVLSPGIFWSLNIRKVNFYSGLQIVYRKYNPAYEHLIYRIYSTQTDTLMSYKYYDIEQQGGYSIGVAPFIGFSANIYKGISLGGEFSSAYSYYKTGGKFSRTETRLYPIKLIETSAYKHTYTAYKFSTVITSINIYYNF